MAELHMVAIPDRTYIDIALDRVRHLKAGTLRDAAYGETHL